MTVIYPLLISAMEQLPSRMIEVMNIESNWISLPTKKYHFLLPLAFFPSKITSLSFWVSAFL